MSITLNVKILIGASFVTIITLLYFALWEGFPSLIEKKEVREIYPLCYFDGNFNDESIKNVARYAALQHFGSKEVEKQKRFVIRSRDANVYEVAGMPAGIFKRITHLGLITEVIVLKHDTQNQCLLIVEVFGEK